jgi:hypothetical protein
MLPNTSKGSKYLVVNAESLVRVLDKLVNRERRVVRLDDSVRDLRRWDNRESCHHAIRELLADLRNEKSAHTSTSTTAERMGNLEALEAVAALGLATDDIQNLVNKFGTFSVMALGPVVASAGLAEDEVVWAEELTERTSTNGVHGARLEIDKDGTRDEFVSGGL